MTEVYYHDAPSRPWHSELLNTVGKASSVWGGGGLRVYASPVYDLTQNVAASAYIFTISHAVYPVVYSIFSGSLPAGLSLNSSTGIISGTPTTVQTTTAIFQILDHAGRTAKTSPVQFVVTGVITDYLTTESGIDITTESGQPIEVT